MRAGIPAWLLALAVGGATPASAQLAFFNEGNRLYQSEEYEGAVAAYERILEDGYENGAVYYNLGNAYFKLGQLGPAILNYERARRLVPGDDDVRANLALARSLTTDDITPLPTFFPLVVVRWWVNLLPGSVLRLSVAGGWVLACAGLVVVVLHRRSDLAKWGGRMAIIGSTIALVLAINLVVRELGIGQPEEAIILVESVSVQSAPSDDVGLQLFTIHEGTKVRLDQRGDEWVEVVLEDGRVGWVRQDVLSTI